jgi:putative restriction endonuclease
MTRRELEEHVASLTVWQRRGERAPHKPLLMLYALGRVLRGESRLVSFGVVDEKMRELLLEFGPPRRSLHPEYPFWRLQNDGLWVVESDAPMMPRRGHQDPRKSELVARHAQGGFPKEIQRLLQSSPSLVHGLADRLLSAHFPASVHEDILASVGLDLPNVDAPEPAAQARHRDASFRLAVLTAYERRCAVCGLDVRLGTTQLALDAAHIMWHQAGGPDDVPNGLALCVLHHKLFDRGAFTITEDRRVLLSESVTGSEGFEDHVLGYHGVRLREPVSQHYAPLDHYLGWHRTQVFRGPGRGRPQPDRA